MDGLQIRRGHAPGDYCSSPMPLRSLPPLEPLHEQIAVAHDSLHAYLTAPIPTTRATWSMVSSMSRPSAFSRAFMSSPAARRECTTPRKDRVTIRQATATSRVDGARRGRHTRSSTHTCVQAHSDTRSEGGQRRHHTCDADGLFEEVLELHGVASPGLELLAILALKTIKQIKSNQITRGPPPTPTTQGTRCRVERGMMAREEAENRELEALGGGTNGP